MTNTFTPAAQATAARLRADRNAWIPVPPKVLADKTKNHKRGTPARRKIRTIL